MEVENREVRRRSISQRIKENEINLRDALDSECGIDSGCIELAVRYLKMVNMNIGNYLTQEHRIEKQNKTMSKCKIVIFPNFSLNFYIFLLNKSYYFSIKKKKVWAISPLPRSTYLSWWRRPYGPVLSG